MIFFGIDLVIWILSLAFGLFGGAIIVGLFYFIFSWMSGKRLKANMPKVDDPELLNPGKPMKLNEEEVKQNEREQLARFREFEKLRRIAKDEGGKSKTPRRTEYDKTEQLYTERISKPELQLDEPSFIDPRSSRTNETNKRDTKKSFQLHEPTDISD